MPTASLSEFLHPGPTVDSGHTEILKMALSKTEGLTEPGERAVALYYAVRDDIRYDPYAIDLTTEGMRASTTLAAGRGWCVTKAILLAACCRAVGIPARIGFADVRNHLSTARMREMMQTDIFYWHGYTAIHLNGKWVKATPAFNIELCDRFGLKTLEFDGREDSVYHPFDRHGQRHMEYLRDRGQYAEPPLEKMIETFQASYPRAESWPSGDADFDADMERETAG
jgi:transglutaminase-like putative cysteine protease